MKLKKGFNDLSTVNPALAEQWDYTANGDLKPFEITANSNMKVGWKCEKNHKWLATVANRTKGSRCPYCLGKLPIRGETDLLSVNPELAEQWDSEANGDLKPSDVTANSGKKVYWKCSEGHKWLASVNNRNKGRKCPYCSGKLPIRGETDLLSVNPELAAQWDSEANGDLKASDITANSSKKVSWKCSRGHTWRASVFSRNKGNGCPCCSGRLPFIGVNDLATVNPEVVKSWDYEKNGDLKPSDVMAASEKKVFWKCEKGHTWRASIISRNKGEGCPLCKSNESILEMSSNSYKKEENSMQSEMRFAVYTHTLIIHEDQLIKRKFIVLKDKKKHMQFTDFHKYIKPPKRTVRNISDDGNNRFDFVVKMLNYAYFQKGISCLNELTVDIVKEFMNSYGMGALPGDEKGRGKKTVERCVACILDFLELYIKDNQERCSMELNELYKYVPKRNKEGKTIRKKIPVFDVVYTERKKEIFRDIPNDAFDLLFEHFATYHKDMLGLISLSAFAGLRPSEACNVRREDSPLGPGILFSMYEGEVNKVQIDLRTEKCLRSDLISTGKIKKKRMQNVPLLFTDAFVSSYNNYMEYIDGQKYEAEYGAFNVNKRGKAITYDNYYQRFVKIVKTELTPLFLKSDNPEIVMFGRLLLENNLSPHVFRHWYTVQLVLSGVDNVAELMEARGDSSPESCLTYLQNKGDLEKQYKRVCNEMFGYNSWVSKRKHEANDRRDR